MPCSEPTRNFVGPASCIHSSDTPPGQILRSCCQAFPSAPRGQVSLDSPCYHLSGRTHPAPAHEKDALSTNNFVSSLSFRTSQKRSRPSEDTDAHSVPVLLWSHTTS